MPKAAVSEQEFMRLFEELQSAAAVAKVIGIDVRNVHDRRRVLERKHTWRAPVFDPRRPRYNTAPVHSANKAIVSWNIENGVILVGSDAVSYTHLTLPTNREV